MTRTVRESDSSRSGGNSRVSGREPWQIQYNGLLPFLDLHAPLTPLRTLVTIGAIGAFTSFRSFAYEAVMLIRTGQRGHAGIYVCSSLVLGIASLVAGLMLGRAIF